MAAAQFCERSQCMQWRQANHFFRRFFFSIFESGDITKHSMTGHKGNSKFCFHSTSTLRVSWKKNSLFPLSPVIKCLLLYLPTEIRFLIGGERVTCHWLKLNDALGRRKLNDALGNNILNFRLARNQVMHLETAGNL